MRIPEGGGYRQVFEELDSADFVCLFRGRLFAVTLSLFVAALFLFHRRLA